MSKKYELMVLGLGLFGLVFLMGIIGVVAQEKETVKPAEVPPVKLQEVERYEMRELIQNREFIRASREKSEAQIQMLAMQIEKLKEEEQKSGDKVAEKWKSLCSKYGMDPNYTEPNLETGVLTVKKPQS